jgi:hypothetical protein
MKRTLAALTTLAVLSSGCGMAVGLRPVSSPDAQVVAAAPPTGSGETEVAGITITMPSSEPSTTAPSETTPSNGTGSTVEKESTTTVPDRATTTPTDPVTTTTTRTPSTTSPETTTTTGESPSTSVGSIPELPDIGTVFADDEASIVHDCAGGDVTILGDAGYFTLEGICNAVLVKGSYNTIVIGVVSIIDLTGTLNAVLHGGGDIEINDWDGENIVTGG